MDEREDYAEPDMGPKWEPAPASLIVAGFAAVVLVGCGAIALMFGFLLGGPR